MVDNEAETVSTTVKDRDLGNTLPVTDHEIHGDVHGDNHNIEEHSKGKHFAPEVIGKARPRRCTGSPFTKTTLFVHKIIRAFVVNMAVHAARNPKKYIVGIITLALTLFFTGLYTNYNVNTSQTVIFAPFNSYAKRHSDWIQEESGFPEPTRAFSVSVHGDGANIMKPSYIRQLFQVVDQVTQTPGYSNFCAVTAAAATSRDNNFTACRINGVTQFFQHNIQQFDALYESGGSEAILQQVSSSLTGNNSTNLNVVEMDLILGNSIKDDNQTSGLITSVQSYSMFFELLNEDGVLELESKILHRMAALQEEWDTNTTSILKVEYAAFRSYSDEFIRAIEKDLPLLPLGFFLMSSFTCLVFFKRDRIQSRCALGIGSVLTILLSLMSSFGLMFICGVPYTNMTQVLPFVVFGVGLDDTFIIMGAYFRTDARKEPAERIRETMQDVGLSISITTITTMLAFLIGSISTIPAIFWLNLYAFPAIAIDFFYQITFFVALVVLDERRIQASRMDCCSCIQLSIEKDYDTSEERWSPPQTKSVPERLMGWYAKRLLRPWVKAVVVVVFLANAAFCAYSTTLLTQHFDYAALLPNDSYVKDFLYSIETYTSRVLGVGIYFRGDFDQLDPEMQQQMSDYIDELSGLPQFADEPLLCWFRDLQSFKDSDLGRSIGMDDNMTLKEQVDIAFSVPLIQETYGKHVVFDDNGTITASSCYTYLTGVNLKVAEEQILVLQDQRAVTAHQPINQGAKDWSFFTFNSDYFIWEFYAVVIHEQVLSTIVGVAAVCAVGVLFFLDWKAILFIFPIMVILYINLIGTLQYAGLHINAVTSICLVISIGLLVDFIVHILLRYYESTERTRNGKIQDTLETMGASILVGGLSTALSVLPLAISTSEVLNTVFVCFFAMIALGVSHGLVFLPVILSICGPTNTENDEDIQSKLTSLEDIGSQSDHAATDTDDTSDDDESGKIVKPCKATKPIQEEPYTNKCNNPHDAGRTAADFAFSDDEYGEVVLHSSSTFRDESLEVIWKKDFDGTLLW